MQSNEIQISGDGNITLQNIHGSTIHIGKGEDSEHTPPHHLTLRIPLLNEPAKVIGREADLAELRQLLLDDQKVVVVNGLGGVGKTTLAQAYLTQYAAEYTHLLWMSQGEGDNFVFDLITAEGLRENLRISAEGKDPQMLFREILATLKNLSGRPNLWIIDNANASLRGYFDYLPKPPHWHLLATSRERIDHFTTKELDFLNEADAVQLFKNHCTRITDEEAIRSLLQTIDYHTLTIEILAKTAQRHDTPLASLQQAIEKDLQAGVYIQHKGDKIERVTSYLLSIFDMSALSAEEQRLLQHFTALPADYVPYELLKALIPEGEEGGIAPGLQDLADKGWLLIQAEPEAYKMHRIIQEVVKRKLLPTVEGLHGLIRRVGALLHIADAKDNPAHKFPFISFGEAVRAFFLDVENEVLAYLKSELAKVFYYLGDYPKSKILIEEAAHFNSTNLGPEHEQTVHTYTTLAILRSAQGDYLGAKDLLLKVVSYYEVQFGLNHPYTTVAYSNLAGVLKAQGDYSLAKVFLEKAVANDKANFGEYHPTTAVRYSNLGIVLHALEDYDEAKLLLEKAKNCHEIILGTRHPTTATTYSNLAGVLQSTGDYAQAKSLFEKAVYIYEINFGVMHPDTIVCYSNLATVLRDLGEYEQAIKLAFKAYVIQVRVLGYQHPVTKIIEGNFNVVASKMLQNGWTIEQIEQLKTHSTEGLAGSTDGSEHP